MRAERGSNARIGGSIWRLQIGTLAVSGYDSRGSARFGAAFERELSRLVERREPPAQSFRKERLLLPRFQTRKGERPELAARRLARLVVDGVFGEPDSQGKK